MWPTLSLNSRTILNFILLLTFITISSASNTIILTSAARLPSTKESDVVVSTAGLHNVNKYIIFTIIS